MIPELVLEEWRVANAVLMAVGFVATVAWWTRHKERLKPIRHLRMLALSSAAFTGAYGSLDLALWGWNLQVPMVSLTAFWVILSAVLPEDFHTESKDKP